MLILANNQKSKTMKNYKRNIWKENLSPLVGHQVTVWLGEGIRNSFDTQISIAGKLEKHSESNYSYRIVNTEGSYCYFDLANITEMGVHDTASRLLFKDGSRAVIRLMLNAPK